MGVLAFPQLTQGGGGTAVGGEGKIWGNYAGKCGKCGDYGGKCGKMLYNAEILGIMREKNADHIILSPRVTMRDGEQVGRNAGRARTHSQCKGGRPPSDGDKGLLPPPPPCIKHRSLFKIYKGFWKLRLILRSYQTETYSLPISKITGF